MKTILITGASSGIGFACAEAAAKVGHIVYAGCRKESDAEKLNTLHENIWPLTLDITKEAQINEAFEFIKEKHGHLDYLFNNAGVATLGPLEFIPLDEFRFQLEVNITAQLAVTQKMLPLLRKSSGARILFTSSISGFFSKPVLGAYAASKHGLEGMADSLRIELAPWDIKVILLQPGIVKTSIREKSLHTSKHSQVRMGEQAQKYYGKLIRIIEKTASEHEGVDVSVVVAIFLDALTNFKPKIRYLVGENARKERFVKTFFGDKLKDYFIFKQLKKLGLA
jgi:NAD(P)-dependent dehydrogenase (short-subunit alcohol dehydrogenase family)